MLAISLSSFLIPLVSQRELETLLEQGQINLNKLQVRVIEMRTFAQYHLILPHLTIYSLSQPQELHDIQQRIERDIEARFIGPLQQVKQNTLSCYFICINRSSSCMQSSFHLPHTHFL